MKNKRSLNYRQEHASEFRLANSGTACIRYIEILLLNVENNCHSMRGKKGRSVNLSE